MGASESILQLKVSLVGVSKPPVWRRVLVPATMRLDRLHDVIQVAMGWTDTHLHAFEAGGVDYGTPDPEIDCEDERRTAVGDLLREPRNRMRYVYDFGDYWQHDVVVEKAREAERGTRYPVCLAGKGCCPPEDCGGTWGYVELREKIGDPTHDEHADLLEWLGLDSTAEFDAHAFVRGE
jgi:Plasmid pRiA4b ORF-3-like protein